MTTAFVTGGWGFIGGRLIEALVADGDQVRALARSNRSADPVRERGVEPVRGDLADRDILRAGRWLPGRYHSAAKLGDWGAWEEFDRDNVEGSRNVAEACADSGVLIASDRLGVGADVDEPRDAGRLRPRLRHTPYIRTRACHRRAPSRSRRASRTGRVARPGSS